MPKFSIDLLALINFLGIVQGFLLSLVFLFTRRGQVASNRLLGGLLLIIALVFSEIFACYTGYIIYFPFLINLTEPLEFLIGPLLLFYTHSLIKADVKLRKKWMHFIPACVYFILRLPYLLQSNDFKLQDVAEAYHHIPYNMAVVKPIWWFPGNHFGGVWMDALVYPFLLVYLMLSFWLISQFTRREGKTLLNSAVRPVRLLSRMLLAFSVMVGLAVVFSFSSEGDTGDIYMATATALMFYVMSFYVITHSELLSVSRMEAEKKKYEKSALDEEKALASLTKLRQVMQSQKLFLNGSLTMPELAEQVRMSSHHLSQLLNEQAGKNFFDFVNEYRVEEMKIRLQDPASAHLKIEELAFESGFNSKSVFNTAFKKFTGLTPSEFRKGLATA